MCSHLTFNTRNLTCLITSWSLSSMSLTRILYENGFDIVKNSEGKKRENFALFNGQIWTYEVVIHRCLVVWELLTSQAIIRPYCAIKESDCAPRGSLAQTVRATTASPDWISPLTISRKYIRSGLVEERERENQLFVVNEHTRTQHRYTCPKAKRGPIFDFLRQLKKGEGNDLLACWLEAFRGTFWVEICVKSSICFSWKDLRPQNLENLNEGIWGLMHPNSV